MISIWIAQASTAADPSSPDTGGGWLLDPELVDPGYSQTIAGGEIQTAFPPPPPPPPPTPEWLKSLPNAIGNFFEWSAPAAKPLMWIAVALILLFLLYPFVPAFRSEEHTSELQSLMRIPYAVFCLNKKKKKNITTHQPT